MRNPTSCRSVHSHALTLVLLASILGATSCDASRAPSIESADYAVVDVSVLPMDSNRVLEHQTVLVAGDRIAWMGPAETAGIPEGAVQIEGQGRWLMPGLAEMHAHVPGGNAPRDLVEDIFFLYVANGITTIRGMLGAPEQLVWREEIQSGGLLGPTFMVGAPSLNGTTVQSPADAERLIRAHKAAGYDFQKIHPGIPLDAWDRMVQVAGEVGFTFAGHVPEDVGIVHALETGISTVDHLDGYLQAAIPENVQRRLAAELGVIPTSEILAQVDQDRLREFVALTVDRGVWNVPTMYLWENFYRPVDPDSMLALPEMQYVPVAMREGWARQKRGRPQDSAETGALMASTRLALLTLLHESGARILTGTDSPQMFNVPGFSLHREMRVMEEAMPPFEVLLTGTRNVASYASEELGLDGDFGVVQVGNRADLLLLEADPRESIDNVARRAGVFVQGNWLPDREIQERLQRQAEKYRR